MQSSKHAFGGTADIVLNKTVPNAVLDEKFLAITLVKKAARVLKDLRLDHDHTFNRSFYEVHILNPAKMERQTGNVSFPEDRSPFPEF
mgnify:CR=1 FL=1